MISVVIPSLNTPTALDLCLQSAVEGQDNLNNIDAFERFIGSEIFKRISSGRFHDDWLNELKKNDFIDFIINLT